MSNYRYEVDDKNVIRIWDESLEDYKEIPIFMQPSYPDGSLWRSHQDAIDWAESWIAFRDDSVNNPMPKSSPDEEPVFLSEEQQS